MPRSRVILSLWLLLGSGLAAQQPPPRAVAVVAEFGGAGEDPQDELLRVRSVLRLADGRLVVANGKPLEVRSFGSDGSRIATLGRQGGGPGEYQYGARVRQWQGDSVVLLSLGTRQWILYGLDGTLVRQWDATGDEYGAVEGWGLIGSAVVRRGIIGSAGCSEELLRRLAPGGEGPLLDAMTDDLGRVWLRPHGAPRWTVHGANGSVLARLDLPPRFRAMQFDDGLLIGVREDEDGFDHVTVMRHGLPSVGRVASPACASTPSGVDPARAAEIKTGMRNAMTSAEAFYSRQRRYPATADDYPDGLKPPNADFRVLAGDERSYTVSIRDRATGYRCIVNVGSGSELEGVLLCGR